MNLYIYSDESGVFDKVHYDYFVFAGLIIPGTDQKEAWSRKYSAAERSINLNNKYGASPCIMTNSALHHTLGRNPIAWRTTLPKGIKSNC